MDDRITNYFSVENRIKDIYLDETRTIAERKIIANQISKDMLKLDLPKEYEQGVESFYFSPLNSHIYKIIHDNFKNFKEEKIVADHIFIARDYTSNLLGHDLLNNTQVSIVPLNQWKETIAEGICISNGFDNHFVFVPEQFSSPVELLCHELAHAAHHTGRRSGDDFWSIPTNRVSAEFVAHFCQNRYILERLTQSHFLAALGQLVTSSFALSIMNYGRLGDFGGYIKSEESLAIRSGWDMEMIRVQYDVFSANIPYLRYEIDRGIGLIMALSLIDNFDGFKKFIRLDRLNIRFDELLKMAFPEVDHMSNYKNINKKIIQLLNRF